MIFLYFNNHGPLHLPKPVDKFALSLRSNTFSLQVCVGKRTYQFDSKDRSGGHRAIILTKTKQKETVGIDEPFRATSSETIDEQD